MEIFALFIWLLLAGTGAVLAPFAVTNPAAGVAAFAAFGGATASVLFIALGAPDWAAWTQLGMALLGILGASLAAAWLSDERVVSGSAAEGVEAMVLGVQIPIYSAVTFVTLLVAAQVTDPVV